MRTAPQPVVIVIPGRDVGNLIEDIRDAVEEAAEDEDEEEDEDDEEEEEEEEG